MAVSNTLCYFSLRTRSNARVGRRQIGPFSPYLLFVHQHEFFANIGAAVARVVHFLREHLVGRTLATVQAQHDENVYGKVGTSAAEFERALIGKKVVGAGQQGKYFW